MTYVKKSAKNMLVCAGDLSKRIYVEVRTIMPPVDGGVDYSEEFTERKPLWAMVETVNGAQIFDGTNIVGQISHRFTVRWRKDLTIQSWVEYQGQKYKIINIENQNQRNRFLILSCTVRGDADLRVNAE